MISEVDEKIERLLRVCSERKVGGILINTQPNFAWLTAGATNGVDSTRENGVGTLFIRADGRRFVLANKIEMARLLEEELHGLNYEPVEFAWEAEKGNPSLVAEMAQQLSNGNSSLGADFSHSSVIALEGPIAQHRYQLTDDEISRFRELGADAGRAIGEMARTLTPGQSETEIASLAVSALARVGATSIVTLVAADERLKRYRHPVPKEVKWKNVVMVVVCARRRGLVASLTRLVCAGKKLDDFARRIQASAIVNAKLFAATLPGTNGSQLYQVAADGYAEAGFPGEQNLHHQGGAAGYRTRDWVAHPQSTDVVLNRQAFAWNPSVTGSKVEETCIAFDNGVEIITASPDWPTIRIKEAGTEYLLPDALEL
jgi:Xaa-Pro dipeptidase